MDSMPKRRKSKDNPYLLSKNENNNLYLISFKDGTNTYRSISVTKEIYDEMDYFERRDLSQMNEYDRHTEHILLDESSLAKKIKNKPISIEDGFINTVTISKLNVALNKLPQIQKKRIIQYYFEGLNCYEIGRREGIAHQVIDRNIKKAIINLKKLLKNLK